MHIVMLTENNEVITIGSNMKFALGTTVTNINCNLFDLKKIEGFKTGEKVVKVSANERSSCMLTSLGKVYYWGQGSEKGHARCEFWAPTGVAFGTPWASLGDLWPPFWRPGGDFS